MNICGSRFIRSYLRYHSARKEIFQSHLTSDLYMYTSFIHAAKLLRSWPKTNERGLFRRFAEVRRLVAGQINVLFSYFEANAYCSTHEHSPDYQHIYMYNR